ncbi:peptide/nickel transport system substrate-binding protein [Tistlia consotensis]|uniref:Peptide/nickel transport system substrate-binding protein n=1 Tax=Tistlia consotensis USBA 355 TaxID=560819 RepID=A0A1Y6BRX5_9PROT|nr:ABC transporter substrate-binding protein [Tistlia consotensis]SMF25021.1 peptide/nickel transport system substrate-binding protein [Tistlia consotensis USBA 355]SNR60182.1 peptide/nickel transport system substrate-binding protein [Tistlia consotensis]
MFTRRQTLGLLASTMTLTALDGTGARRAFAQDGRPVLRVAVQALGPSLEPLESMTNVGLRAIDCLFDRPLRRNFVEEERHPGKPAIDPQLATSVTQVSPLVWEMTLRPGVRLHDGTTLSAEDVLATFGPDRIGPDSPYPDGKILFGHVTEVEKVDDMTVRLHTRQEDVVMRHRLAGYGPWIIGAKAYRELGPEGFKAQPVGAGPYKLKEFVRDTRIVFASHDDYWMGAPAAAEVVISVVPEVATRVAGLISGEYDIVTNVLPDQVPQFAGYADVEAETVPMDLLHLLFFDYNRPAVADAKMRRALSFAIDYDAVAKAVWGPRYRRPNNFQIPAFGDLYDPNRKYFTYDPDQARELLSAAGYAGGEIVLRVPPSYYLGSGDAAQIIQAQWQALGINTRLEFAESAAQQMQPGADVRMISSSFRYPDPLSGGVIVHLGRNSYLQKHKFFIPRTDYNEVCDQFAAATAPEERKRLFWRLLDLLEEEAPVTILYAVNEIVGKRTKVNWTQYPLYYMDLRPDVFSFA